MTVFMICLLAPAFLCSQAWAVDVQISQLTDDPDPAVRGGQITYSIFVENNADDTAHDVVLTFPLPATTSFVSVGGHPGCSHDGGTPGTVTCTFGDLVGTLIGGPVYQIDTVIRTSGATGSTIDVTGTITTSDTDTNPANNTLTQNTTIDDGADLVVAKTDSPDPVIAGGNVTYTITVTNNGPNDAYTIIVTDTLPTNMTFVSAGGPGWSCSRVGQVVTCQRSSIANGATAPAIALVGRVTGAITGTITNTVTVSAATGDPDVDNNTTTQDTQVTLGTDLAITKIVSPNPALSNQTATFTLRPRNNGPFPADNVQVTDTLPADFTYVSASGTDWSCSHDGSVTGGVVTCTRANYAVGAANNITITTTAPTVVAVTPASNSAAITSDTPDPVSGNNSATLNFNVVPDGVDLSLTKTKAPNPVAQGSPMTSTFTVHNNGPQTAASGTITVTDTLDNLLETYSDPNYTGTNWTCSYAAPTITCTYNAALASGANSSALSITTTAVGVGNITNNAVVSYSGTPGDWDNTNNTTSATVTSTDAAISADLIISKATSTAGGVLKTLETGEGTVTYTLIVTNAGPGAADGVVVSDAIPGYIAGSTVVNAAVTGNTSTATFDCTTGATVTCTQNNTGTGTIDVGETVTFTITATRPLLDGSFTNTATVTSTTLGDPVPDNNSASDTITIDPICDVEMQPKSVSPSSVPAGTQATYVLTFRNRGPSTAQNVVVTDDFNVPAGGDTDFTFISATAPEGTCTWDNGAKILTCTGITLNNGESRTVTVRIRPNWQSGDPTREIRNTATISTTTYESNGGNNSDDQTLTVTSSDLDLLVNKTDLIDPIGFDTRPGYEANNIITYLVRITNRGASLATGVVLTDAMTPKNGKTLTFLGDWQDAGGTIGPNLCDNVGVSVDGPGTQTITCNFPNLAANTSYNRYLRFQVMTAPDSTGDTHNNIATVSVNEHDRLPANDSEAETTSVRMRVDLAATKVPSLATVQLREPFHWTITVTNNGPGDSDVTTLTDTLPADMEFFGATPSWSKTGTSPGTGTCTIAGQDLTCNLGMLSSGGVATITMPVRAIAYPTGGTTTNCATATTNQFDPDATNNTNQCGTVTVVQGSSLAGFVYLDRDNDGVMDIGEDGIAGAQLAMTGVDNFGNTVTITAATDATGAYLFDNLPLSDASGYTVTETQPAAWADGLDSAGTAGGTLGNDIIADIIFSVPTTAIDYDFGEIGGSLAGTVYNDINDNGVDEPAEPGIPNATVTLTGTDITGNAINLVTTTAADGSYSFSNLPMPNATGYTITETQPAGWNDGQDTLGTLGGTLGNDVFSGILFPIPGAAGTGYNFGEIEGTAGVAQVSGKVWLDTNHDRIDNDGNPRAGWTVELIQRTTPFDTTYTLIATTLTNAAGEYAIDGLSPGTYEIRFRYPSTGYVYGIPISAWPGVDLTYGTIRNLTLVAGDNVLHQDLPLDPGGVVYDAVTRVPIAGAVVTLAGPPGFDPAIHLVGGAVNVSQTTDATGVYQFNLFDTAPDGVYTLTVTAPAGYLPITSAMIPPCSNTLTVLAAPAPALVQNNAGPPTTSTPGVCPADSSGLAAGADTTQYFLAFDLQPGVSANVVNNHIPLDPAGEALLITKTVNKRTVSVGDLILYTLRIQNTTSADLTDITIRDNIPPGFKYVEGSARIDGQPITPVGNRPIEFQGLTFLANQTRTITYILVVGSGVQEGEYENTAFALRTGNRISNIARASVCVIKDPILELTTIIGKVFDDKNENGVQDEGEEGIAMAKVVSVRGEIITTDAFGRYHIAGVDPGRYDRGRNFILKVDPKSLPQGARFTTENPRVVRITSALMKKINFGVKLPEKEQTANAVSALTHPQEKEGRGDAAPAATASIVTQQGGNTTPDGKAPAIAVTQDRFLTAPKLNLTIGNADRMVRTAKGMQEDIAFFIYTNYPDFIQEYRIIIYAKADLECKYPLKTIVLEKANNFEPVYWDGTLDNGALIEKNKEYKYILRVYNNEGRKDETLPKFFTVSSGALLFESEKDEEETEAQGKFPGFGIDNTAQRSIIPEGGKVVIYGKDLAPTDSVYIDEQYVAVDEDGSFVVESIEAPGEHEFTIAVKDAEGTVKASQVEQVDVGGEKQGSFKAFFKDFFQDFFIVGIVDMTLGQYSFGGHVEPVAQDDHYDEKIYVDGRAAFYLKGKIKGKYLLTAYLDTEDGKIQDIYKRLGDKDPKRIFRNLDPDRYYPVYGDDSTLISDVETQGRFYVKLEWNKSKVLWGNYHTQITGTELARYNRSLYGAKVYYESLAETKFGDSKGIFTGFISECQSLQDHNEFLSTGGSLYYLKHQRVVEGSEKVAIEIRDKDSGRVINTATLVAGADYDIDYYQGRLILSSPLPILASTSTIISSALMNGDDVFLIVDYEHNSECFGCNDGPENLTGGVRGFGWLNDYIGVGGTFVREKRDDTDYNLFGIDARIKLFKGTYTNLEFASSQQTQIPGSFSVDGGLSFSSIETSADRRKGNAYKIEQVVDFREITDGSFPLDLEAYYILRERGFSSLGKETEHDTTEFGLKLRYDITEKDILRLKHSTFDEEDDFYESTSTVQYERRWTDRFRSFLEVRHKKIQEDEDNVQPVHPEADAILGTQEDVIAGAKLEYDFDKGIRAYAAQQVTLYRNDETPEDNKTTLGIAAQITNWLNAGLEGFAGNLGYGGRVGLTTTIQDNINTYTNYLFSIDRTEGRTHKVIVGSTYKMNDKTDIYSENQFKDSDLENADSYIIGVRYLPSKRWHIDVKYESAHVTKDTVDSYVEHNIIKRDTAAFGVTYNHGHLRASSRFEMRFDRGDETQHQYITTNTIKYDVNKEWTLLGEFNYSLTRNKTYHTDDSRFMEINAGFAYRPIKLDKLNLLFKYTFLEDLAPLSQDGSTDVDERSHVVSLEGIYDLSRFFSLGGKAAYKSAQMRTGRTSGEWYSSDTILFVGRIDYHVIKNWDASLEYRLLRVVQADDFKHGPLVCLYRHFGDHVKVGVGYNFTDYNDDLTNLNYESGGWFVNFVATW